MDLVGRARTFGLHAHGSEEGFEHPLEVARLVESAGFPDDVVAAALLHDVIEDTDVDAGRIAGELGSRIAALVSTLTEDEALTNYSERKADLRMRACSAGPDVAIVFVADKLSNTRRMRRGQKAPKERKIAHYETSLAMARRAHPDLPLLDQLGRALAALRRETAVAPSTNSATSTSSVEGLNPLAARPRPVSGL